jgi:glycosyltransferase involved in cell wall biosynthesis
LTVRLFFRKKRPNANFSIENSFHQMMKAFPSSSNFQLESFTTSYHSTGIINRALAVFEAQKHQGEINHIIGDIHFLTLGLSPSKTILTIHDCGFLEYYTNPIQQWILKYFWLTVPVRRSRIITVVSQATKDDVLKYTNCPEEKIRIIPTIIGDYFKPITKQFNVQYPTILHLGTAVNKNLERHIAALAGIPCHFRIIGKLSDKHKTLLAQHKIEYSAVVNISNQEIQEEYAKVDMVLFASTLEGFGMPILEAQTVGRPVITSNISSMPEVAGNSACLVDPLSIVSIRAGILKIIQDEIYRNSLIQKGFENIKRFQAETVARQYEAVYKEVLSSSK